VQRVVLPGSGNGSPVFFQGQAVLLTTNAADATRTVVGVDLEKNKVAWSKSYPSVKHPIHGFSSYASSTPCTDGKLVFVAWADPQEVVVRAFQSDGSESWMRTFPRYVSQHGFGTSPMVVDGKLILLNSQDAEELPPGIQPGQDVMIALDTQTGNTVWSSELPTTRVCYGVPCIYENGGKKELLCSTTGQGMFSLDSATGKVLWNHDCFTQRVCSSALLVGDVLIGTHGSGGGRDNRLVAWDVVNKKELFRVNRAAPYVPTPVAKDGLLFLWSDAGIVSCVEMKSGEVIWSKRIGSDYSGSPVILGDKLINASHTGVVTFLTAGREFVKIGEIETNQTIRSTIAANGSQVLLRTDSELWVIR
jgi:outer membrane protein assembly factor BamB